MTRLHEAGRDEKCPAASSHNQRTTESQWQTECLRFRVTDSAKLLSVIAIVSFESKINRDEAGLTPQGEGSAKLRRNAHRSQRQRNTLFLVWQAHVNYSCEHHLRIIRQESEAVNRKTRKQIL